MKIKILLIYFMAVSVIAVFMAVIDKYFAKHGKRRISENALMCAAGLGGAFSMLVCMLFIRHKTKHLKFMAGLPLIILIHLIFAFFIVFFVMNKSA